MVEGTGSGGGQQCHLCVGEEESSVMVLYAGVVVQFFEVIVERGVVVTAAELNLKALVSTDVRS